ncbi:hypothetical protein QCA50_001775 [Cerrena zonata]|uniref:Uncharacterized protein n=1 Tax=Cerrena zonata TaxID=2478898 RepID=A0AAW0GRW8_9APHY
MSPDPPTPNVRDIHLQSLQSSSTTPPPPASSEENTTIGQTLEVPNRDPPAYSPLDAFAYSDGVQLDLPADVLAAAIERGTLPSTMMGSPSSHRSERHRHRRERRS